MRRRSSGFIVLGCALLLPGCGATERAAAVPYAIAVDVAPDVNPDLNRKPSPIVLKVFQLRAASAFDGADFFSLQDKPENILGADLLGTDRVILRPGESRTLHYRGNVEAGAIGVGAVAVEDLDVDRQRLVELLLQLELGCLFLQLDDIRHRRGAGSAKGAPASRQRGAQR